MQVAGELKRGETFSVDVALTDAAGAALDLDITANSVTSQIRSSITDALLAQATVTKTATLGTYNVKYSGSTASWPIGFAYFDIRAVIDTEIVKSKPTIGVNVIKDQTRG